MPDRHNIVTARAWSSGRDNTIETLDVGIKGMRETDREILRIMTEDKKGSMHMKMIMGKKPLLQRQTIDV
jgi:hypothetical protein